MKIGIDAKWLFTGHISGKLFIQNILPELFALHPEIEWHIFLDKRNKDFTLPFKNDNIKIHYIWAKFNMISNLFILPGLCKAITIGCCSIPDLFYEERDRQVHCFYS